MVDCNASVRCGLFGCSLMLIRNITERPSCKYGISDASKADKNHVINQIGYRHMAMHTRYGVTCPCGHTGAVKMSENDQPYSSCWESYSLEGLNGEDQFYTDSPASIDNVFSHLKPVCPHCGTGLTPEHLDKHHGQSDM